MLHQRGIEASATPGGKGQFDVVSGGELVYSKHDVGRFPGENEVLSLLGGR